MNTMHLLSATVFAVTIALSGSGLAQSVPAPSTATAGGSIPPDCAPPKARHDHGVEKGTYGPKTLPAPCASPAAAAVSASAASAPANRRRHDHTKFR